MLASARSVAARPCQPAAPTRCSSGRHGAVSRCAVTRPPASLARSRDVPHGGVPPLCLGFIWIVLEPDLSRCLCTLCGERVTFKLVGALRAAAKPTGPPASRRAAHAPAEPQPVDCAECARAPRNRFARIASHPPRAGQRAPPCTGAAPRRARVFVAVATCCDVQTAGCLQLCWWDVPGSSQPHLARPRAKVNPARAHRLCKQRPGPWRREGSRRNTPGAG